MRKLTKIKQIIIVGLSLLSLNISAQEILRPTSEKTYTEYIDKVLHDIKFIDDNNIKNKILYDRVFPIANLVTFNDSVNVSSYNHFIQSWSELSRAKIDQGFMPIEKLKKIAFHFEKQNIIQIGLINVDYSIIDTTALKSGTNQKLKLVNKKVKKIANKNPYVTKHTIVISPLNSEMLNGSKIHFQFGKFVLNSSDKKIKNLIAHFENNKNYVLINNGIKRLNDFNVSFKKSGIKEISFDITYFDNTTQTTNARFYVNTSLIANRTKPKNVSEKRYIRATKQFQGYDEPNDCHGDCYGKGEYIVYFANGHKKITKPFIIVDGFDPGDIRRINEDEAIDPDDDNIYGMMKYKDKNDNSQNLVNTLNTKGYDVIILNFPKYVIQQDEEIIYDYYDYYDAGHEEDYVIINRYRDGGADYIERNAKVLEALIEELNTNMKNDHNTNTIKVAGPSMGALIVQYALAEMEADNKSHNVDLYVSFDGPHKGANIPIGMQKAIEYFNIVDALYPLYTPAAKQMLINHYLSYSEGLPKGAPKFRNRFQNELERIGFPKQCTNIAVINGSIIGKEKSQTDGTFLYGYLSTIGAFLQRELWVNYTRDSGQKVVFRYLKKNWWGARTQADIQKKNSSSAVYGSLDNSSGGYFNTKGRIEEKVGKSFPMTNMNFGHWFNFSHIKYKKGKKIGWFGTFSLNVILRLTGTAFYVNMNDDFCFVPTKSSLAFTGSNYKWRECLGSRNLVCTGETPFDSYYAPTENQEHADLHIKGITWLISAINAIDQNTELPKPSLYNSCSTSTQGLKINGSNEVCLNDTETFTITSSDQCTAPGDVTWSTSNNIKILSQSNDKITIKTTSDIGNKWIKATSKGVTYTKKIISKPSFTTQTENDMMPSIKLVGDWIDLNSQNISSVTWTQISGDGFLHGSSNNFSAFATGTGNSWHVTGQVQVANSCGITTRIFAITPFLHNDPCGDNNTDNDYFIQKTNSNTYRVINPCQNNIHPINSAELYNIYGTKTQQITPNQDKINFNNQVKSGEIKIIKATVKDKVLTKTIITD